MMKYAINIGDLTLDMMLAQILVTPHIQSKQIVEAEKTIDGGAVILECEEDQAVAIVHVIRLKHHKNHLRCYHSKTGRGGWKRI